MNKLILVMVMSTGFIVAGCGNQQQAGTTTDQQVTATAAQAQKSVSQTASDVAQKARTLLAQAKQYLDQGKLDEAISVAQNVLSFDPKNLDAQKIIDMAKAKLKALAEQAAGDLKSGLMNKLGTTGK